MTAVSENDWDEKGVIYNPEIYGMIINNKTLLYSS